MPDADPTPVADELDPDEWDEDDLDEAADLEPPQPADGGAYLTEADKQHDQDDHDEAEANRQLAAVDAEQED